MGKNKYYITTPIYYVNDKPHIGHAYTTFVCDALARYHRLKGDDVFFSTGTDENSQKNVEAMEALGEKDLPAYLDRMADTWKKTWNDLGITFDGYIRTTEDRHLKAVERFWNAANESGDIYKGTYEGLYCAGCEKFVTESDVVEEKCQLHPNKELKTISEENYFFKLSNYRNALLKLYQDHPEFIKPDARRNEIIRYVTDHLTDISISRAAKSISCGIPVPGDDSQRIYVWFDALINYLSVIGYGTDDELVKKWWPADLHMVGKDIIKFHCTMWPAMLLSAGTSDELLEGRELPKTVFAHGFFTIDGQKISKSLGNAVDPRDLIPTYGLDAIRYFLLREISFGEDGDFSQTRLNERYKADLANTLGNFVHRAISMSRRYFDNKVPKVDLIKAGASPNASVWDGAAGIASLEKTYDVYMEETRVDRALETVWSAGEVKSSGIIQANKFVEETKPFKLVKQDAMKVGEILYGLLETTRHYAWLLDPIMPDVSKKIIESLGQDYEEEKKKTLSQLREWGGLKMGSELPEPSPIFPRLGK
jgi:methionyl-tRNA synthetase